MKLLFIQGGSRVRICSNNKKYVDGNFSNDIWNRYKGYCNDITVLLRKNVQTYNEDEIKSKLNYIDEGLIDLILLDDIYSPKKNFLNFKMKKKISDIIEEYVKKSDRVIIRSIGNFYTNTALKFCIKYNKKYLIEVTGFALDSLWYHSLYGKIVAVPREMKLIDSIKNAPYAVYVTDVELQKRYPSNGKMLGCSDVELFDISEDYFSAKQEQLSSSISKNKFKIGTAGFLDVAFKGQKDVIKALYLLKKQGYNNFCYEMIGTGTGKKLLKLINKYDLSDNVKIIGALSHNEVKDWLSQLDIYVHPSYTEGLCRSIIEAMGMACPVICTDAGGNKELIDNLYIYKKGNYKLLVDKLKLIINDEQLLKQSLINFENSMKYNKTLLDLKREKFYKEFING